MKKSFFSSDPIQDRRDEIAKIEKTEYDLPKRTDMTVATNTSKLVKFPLTGAKDFNSNGIATYRNLRSEFVSVLVSQMIMLDVMYNYIKEGDEGLALKDGFGPVTMSDLGTVNKSNPFPLNPYVGSIDRCEDEAYTILMKMAFNGQFKTVIIKNQQRNLPVLNVLAFYDKLFFKMDAHKIGRYRSAYLNMTFSSQSHFANTYAEIEAAKAEYEEARGSFHQPWEDLQQLCDAVENSDVSSHFRDFLRNQRKEWTAAGKGFSTDKQKASVVDLDVQTFFLELLDQYQEQLGDGKLPLPIRRMPTPHGHLSHVNEMTPSMSALSHDEHSMAEQMHLDPSELHSYLSMSGTPSHGTADFINPTFDSTQLGNPRQPSVDIDTRRSPPNRSSKKVSFKPGDVEQTAPAKKGTIQGASKDVKRKYPDDEKCREYDAKRAKDRGLAQEIACRRKIIDKLGNATDCHKEHLTNHCPFAPKVKLAMLNPLHPYQTDSPIRSLDEWNRLFPGASPFVQEPAIPKTDSTSDWHIMQYFQFPSWDCADWLALSMVIFALLGAVCVSAPTVRVEGASSLTNANSATLAAHSQVMPPAESRRFPFHGTGVGVMALSSNTVTFKQVDIWLFNAVFALLAATRFTRNVPSLLMSLAILVNFSTGADALEVHALTPDYRDTAPTMLFLLVVLLPFFGIVLAGFMSTILTVWTRTVRPFLDSLLMQLVDIDTEDGVRICCFSVRQQSPSHAVTRFSKMVSSFRVGSKMKTYHVDNDSGDSVKQLSMACACAYDYDMATMATSLLCPLSQQLTKLACLRLPEKHCGQVHPFSGKRMMKGKVFHRRRSVGTTLFHGCSSSLMLLLCAANLPSGDAVAVNANAGPMTGLPPARMDVSPTLFGFKITVYQWLAWCWAVIVILQSRRMAKSLIALVCFLVAKWQSHVMDLDRNDLLETFGKKIANLVFVMIAGPFVFMAARCMPINRVCGLIAVLASCFLVVRRRTHYWLPLLVSFLLMTTTGAIDMTRKRAATKSLTSLVSPNCPPSSVSSLPPLVFPTTNPQLSHILNSPHCMLGTVNIRGATIDNGMPDTGSNYNVAPDVSYLHHVQMDGPLPVDGIDKVNATHLGVMRVSHLTKSGELVTQDIRRTIVIPSCGTVLFGNNNDDFVFDSWNKEMKVLHHGDRSSVIHEVPVQFDGGTFTLPTYVHRVGSQLCEGQIKNLLLEASGHHVPVESPEVNLSFSAQTGLPFSPLKVADLCCGIGSVTEASLLHGAEVVAAADVDPTALLQYDHRHSGNDIRLYGDLTKALHNKEPGSLVDVMRGIDVCVAGTPCSDFSILNLNSDRKCKSSSLLLTVFSVLTTSRPKMFVLENVTELYTAQQGTLYEQLVAFAADHGYTCVSHIENSSRYGPQSRKRLWPVFVRNDVEAVCGRFLWSIPKPVEHKSIRPFLDEVSLLEADKDLRSFVFHDEVRVDNRGLGVIAHTGKSGPRNAAYSVDYACPTITSGHITIYDDRVGYFRRLSLSEKSRIMGFGDYTFDPAVTASYARGLIGRAMDVRVASRLIEDCARYLQPVRLATGVVPVGKSLPEVPDAHSMLSANAIHESFGHPGKEVSKAQGIPYPDHCDVCEMGNRTKAPRTSGVVPRGISFGNMIHVDFKISSTPSSDKVTVLCGAVDDATNFGWVVPMEMRSEVLRSMREIRANIRQLGGELRHIHTDNDSVITARSFRNYLVEDPEHLLTLSLCPPHHHNYNGRIEVRWKVLKAMAVKAMAQLAVHIRDDAEQYWDLAYVWANSVLNNRMYKPHGSDTYVDSPNLSVTGSEVDVKNMPPFGTLCTVHDHLSSPHALPSRTGVILGSSMYHSDCVHKVLMLDTRRVIQSMDVTFTPLEHQDDVTLESLQRAEGTCLEDLFIDQINDPMLGDHTSESSPQSIEPPNMTISSVNECLRGTRNFSSSFSKGAHKPMRALNSKGAQHSKGAQNSKGARNSKGASKLTKYKATTISDFYDHIIRVSGLSKGGYLDARANTVANVFVKDALRMKVKNKAGKLVSYTPHDLVYDLKSRLYLEAAGPADCSSVLQNAVSSDNIGTPVAMSSHVYDNDANWMNSLPSSDSSRLFRENGTLMNSMFDDRAQTFLRFMTDAAPLSMDTPHAFFNHAVEIEWEDGDLETYDFVPDAAPHSFTSVHDPGHTPTALDKPPRSLREVHRLPSQTRSMYLKALAKEYMGLWNRGMFKLHRRSDFPAGTPVFPTTTVFKMKFHADGSPDRAKARVCVRGDLMIPGRDFGAINSPTTQCESVKLMMSECPNQGLTAVTYDIQQAFTYGKTDPSRCTLIKQFPGTDKILDEDTGEELVMKLINRLYGDPAAPRAFHVELVQAYFDFVASTSGSHWKQSKADPCVFFMQCSDGSWLKSAIFVDDSCTTFKPGSCAHQVYLEFVAFLKTRFDLKDNMDGMDKIKSFLGMNLTWDEHGEWLRIDQPHAIDKLVVGSGVDTSIPKFTPLPPGTEVMLNDCPDLNTPDGIADAAVMKSKPYRKRIGEALWIARTSRPDIQTAVAKLSTVCNNPGLVHWELTDYLIQYLHHTRHLGLLYTSKGSTYPYGFVDAAFSPHYGNDDDDYRSFEGYLFKNAGAPIAWSAKFQKNLCMSSSEAEYYGLTSAAMKAAHLTQLCSELGIYSDEPFLIYEDNKAAIKMAENSCNSKRTVHLDRRAHFIREQVNNGAIQLDYCPTKLMQADMMTKIMPRPGFEALRSDVGLSYAHAPLLTPRMQDSFSR